MLDRLSYAVCGLGLFTTLRTHPTVSDTGYTHRDGLLKTPGTVSDKDPSIVWTHPTLKSVGLVVHPVEGEGVVYLDLPGSKRVYGSRSSKDPTPSYPGRSLMRYGTGRPTVS